MSNLTKLDHEMIAVAKRRGIIRLDDGMVVTLVSWGSRRRYGNVRVEGTDGETRWTVKKRQVVEVVE